VHCGERRAHLPTLAMAICQYRSAHSKAFDYIDRKYPTFKDLQARRLVLEEYLRANTWWLRESLRKLRKTILSIQGEFENLCGIKSGFIEGDLDRDTVGTLDQYLRYRVPKDYNYNAEEDESFIQTLRGTRQLRMTVAKAQALLDRVYHVYQDVEQGYLYKNEVDLWHAAVETFKFRLIKSLRDQGIFFLSPGQRPQSNLVRSRRTKN